MLLYFDTSFLAPLILQEASSVAVEQFMEALPAGSLAISHWTGVEFASLLAREARMGGLQPHVVRDANAQFDAIVKESFALLLPKSEDFKLAKEYLGHHETGLRAGDALHLAIAKNHHADAIYSLDKTLIKAGKVFGLPVSVGIRHAE